MSPHPGWGTVALTTTYEPETGRRGVRIDRADPRALIDVALLADIRHGRCEPWAHLDSTPAGFRLTLTDNGGQRFIYRIGRYIPGTRAHEMEWPD